MNEKKLWKERFSNKEMCYNNGHLDGCSVTYETR